MLKKVIAYFLSDKQDENTEYNSRFQKIDFKKSPENFIENILDFTNQETLKKLDAKSSEKIISELLLPKITNIIVNKNNNVPVKYRKLLLLLGLNARKKENSCFLTYLEKIIGVLNSPVIKKNYRIQHQLLKEVISDLNTYKKTFAKEIQPTEKKRIEKIEETIKKTMFTVKKLREDADPIYRELANKIYVKKPGFSDYHIEIMRETTEEISVELTSPDNKILHLHFRYSGGARPGEPFKILTADQHTNNILGIK